jgi:lysophospholipase L1-like esterase
MRFIVLFLFFCSSLIFFIQGQTAKVACIGNSITAYRSSYPIIDANSYPVQLRIVLGSSYGVANFGISGTTMLKNGDNTYWDELAFHDALAYQPDIVTIMLGTNDSKPQNWDPYGEAEFIPDYNAMIDTLLLMVDPDPEIYLCLPTPAFSSVYSIRDSVIYNSIVPKILQIAGDRSLPIIDFYTHFTGKGELFYDGVHPTLNGLWEMTKFMYKILTGDSIQEIKDVNLALNKTVLTAVLTGTPANIVDGDRNTIWSCNSGEPFTIDLGEADSTNMFQIIFNEPAVYQYTIETSSDSSNWATAVDQSANPDEISFAVDSIASTETRYVRFSISSTEATIPMSEVRILKTAPFHAPVLTSHMSDRRSTYTRYGISVTSANRGGALKYTSADSIDQVFEAEQNYQIVNQITTTTLVYPNQEKYLCAKFYKNNFEVASDTIKISYVAPSGMNEETLNLPYRFRLYQNYPNPFNPETTIPFQIPKAKNVLIRVLNSLGQEIVVLADKQFKAGYHIVYWDGKNKNGRMVASGIYFYQLITDDFTSIKKMILLR